MCDSLRFPRSYLRRAGIIALLTSLFSVSAGAATFIVTNLDDRGPGSLRQAVIDANAQPDADNKIEFASGVTGSLLIVNTIKITDDLELIGPGADQMTISSSIVNTVFQVGEAVTVTISNLKIANSLYSIENQGKLTINDCTISANVKSGIYSNGKSLIVNGSTISDNNDRGIFNVSGSVEINSSTISDNKSSKNGGGIYNESGILTISNSTISGNTITAAYGGGIYNKSGSLKISSSTISGNISLYNGGIYSGNKVSIGNSLVVGNGVLSGAEIYMSLKGNFSSLGYNLFGQNRSSGLVNATPADDDIILVGDITTAIAPLADNGGLTHTHLLVARSQALDAGSNSLIPADTTTDQRGAPRIEYSTVDIGAVEGTDAFVTASTFSLLINKVGDGTITSNPTGMTCNSNSTICTGTFNSGTLVKLTAKPATGYTFNGWSDGSCSGTGICSVTMSAAQTIKATFITPPIVAPVTSYSLSISKAGNGSVTSNPVGITCGTVSACAVKFASNEVVTLTAKPDAGATFVSWSGCLAFTTNPLVCSVTMSNNKTVTATFGTKDTAATAADVRVMSIVINPVSPTANSNFVAVITVENTGDIKSNNGYLDVWADQATLQTCNAKSDNWKKIDPLEPGESKTIAFILEVRSAGAKKLRAFMDSECTFIESNETNNQLVKNYTVK